MDQVDYSDDTLSRKSWDELMDLRNENRKNRQLNELLAPYEHRAWAREQVEANPSLAPLYTILPFGYQAAKLMGYKTSTPPSLSQLVGGLRGTLEGVQNAYSKRFK